MQNDIDLEKSQKEAQRNALNIYKENKEALMVIEEEDGTT